MATEQASVGIPKWFWVVGGLGLLWNIFGVVQFVQSVASTQESLKAMGMTDAQATVMKGYPIWMTVGFAVGTIGGLIGSILLLLRKKLATPIFAASLVGYVILYIGDVTEGVFAALGQTQIIILTSVVLIAGLLLWMSKVFERRGNLTSF